MSEIKLTKRFPESRPEDITEAYMRGYEAGRKVSETCEVTNSDAGELDVDVYALSCGHVVYYPAAYETLPGYCPECGAKVVSE